MTLPPVIRIFFAIDLPTTTKESLGHFISMLKKKSKSHAIRWTRPENLHITLQFLAEVKTEHLSPLLANVRANIAKMPQKINLSFGALHLFPNPYRPRVIVLEILPQDILGELSKAIGMGIQALQYEIDDRPFRAHLTLGRIKHVQGVQLDFLSDITIPDITTIETNEVVLFRSEPHPEGSSYTPLEKITLSPPMIT